MLESPVFKLEQYWAEVEEINIENVKKNAMIWLLLNNLLYNDDNDNDVDNDDNSNWNDCCNIVIYWINE